MANHSEALNQLLKGNERFRSGNGEVRRYSPDDLKAIAQNQAPIAAVIACSDSRMTPEILFDQPLGALFCSRVPGNVASDSALWMVEIAVSSFKTPVTLVLGHTGCLAVTQVYENENSMIGGALRTMVNFAVHQARSRDANATMEDAIKENIRLTIEELPRRSPTLRHAQDSGVTQLVGAIYHMETGEVELLDA